MKKMFGAVLIGVGIAAAVASPAQAARPIDGSSLDEYRLLYGFDKGWTGDAMNDIPRDVQLMRLGWHGFNN